MLSLFVPSVPKSDSSCVVPHEASLRVSSDNVPHFRVGDNAALNLRVGDNDSPRLELERQTCDLGRLSRSKEKKVKCRFRFRNTGGSPLVIDEVETSCGCTSATFTRKPILPGGTGVVKVEFAPSSQPVGPFRKSIVVYTNAPGGYSRLFIKGGITE